MLPMTTRLPRRSSRWIWRAKAGARLAVSILLPLMVACEPGGRRNRSADRHADVRDEPSAPYQAEVEEGLGAAVAILIDTSGSMRDDVPGESRPKYVVARDALEAMLDATDEFVRKR